MKIAYVTMRFPKRSETFAQVETRQLVTLGHEVSVYTMHPEKRDEETSLADSGVAEDHLHRPAKRLSLSDAFTIFRYPVLAARLLLTLLVSCWRTPHHLLKALVLLPTAMGLFHRMNKENPDVVHLFWGHYPAIVGWLWLTSRPGRKLSMFLGAYDLMYRFPLSRILGRHIQAQKRGVLLTHAHANLSAIEDFGLNADQVVVSYRGVDLSRLPQSLHRERTGRVLSAGRLIPEKGMAVLIQAFARVSHDYPESELIIAGEGPQSEELSSLVVDLGLTGRVHLVGYVDQLQLFEEMSSANMFVLLSSSWSERLPNVVKEAMALGVRPLVHQSPGMDELVPSPDLGTVIDELSISKVAESLAEGLNHSQGSGAGVEARKRRQWIEQTFDVRAVMARRCDLWQSCRNS